MVTTVTTSALGVVFWAVASHLYPAAQIGQDAALLSAMMLLSIVCQMNLGMGIARLLPQVGRRRWRPVALAYAATAAVGLAVAGGFVVVAPRFSSGFGFLADAPLLAALLVGSVVLCSVFALQDAVLTASRRAALLPIENGLFGVLKIGLIVGLAGSFVGHGVFTGWVVAMALMVLPVNLLLFSRVLPAGNRTQHTPPATVLPLAQRGMVARYLATDYAAALLSQGYNAALPLLVIGVLGGAANAYFYIAFLIASAVGALAQALSTALVVEGAHDESSLPRLARRSVVRYLTLVAPAVVILVIGAELVLRPFGPAYVQEGTTVLRLLLMGTLPQAVVMLYLGVERVRARVTRVLAAEAATVVLVTIGSVLGMRWFGLDGVGLAWLVAQSAVALAVAPRLRRVWRTAAAPGRTPAGSLAPAVAP
jgi:O-antigen/teichoic acid export membrane protein